MAQVFPTKANLMATQKSLELAKLGYELMDKKRNILIRELMQLVSTAKTCEQELQKAYKEAYRHLHLANITLGLCQNYAAAIPIDTKLELDAKSVMGVEIPTVQLPETECKPFYGFRNTNSYLDEAYIEFNKAKALTAEYAELKSSVFRLTDEISKTQKRANALHNIMIPRFTETIKMISEALDEKEREDFTRLKVVKSQKEKQKL